MKSLLVVVLLLLSNASLAVPPDCVNKWVPACDNNPQWISMNNDVREVAAVPEPGMLALLGIGLSGLLVARRRKR